MIRLCLSWKDLIWSLVRDFSVKIITNLRKEKDQNCTFCVPYITSMVTTAIIHSKTHKRENHHEISRIASMAYTFPSFHTADSDLNSHYTFRTLCLILVTIFVTRCLAGGLVAKDASGRPALRE